MKQVRTFNGAQAPSKQVQDVQSWREESETGSARLSRRRLNPFLSVLLGLAMLTALMTPWALAEDVPEWAVGLKALADENSMEFPWNEWDALMKAADDSLTSDTLDRDGDGLFMNADPNDYDPDVDGDGFTDGYEVAQGTDPLDPASRPALGDVNGDGAANNVDAMVIFYHLLGQYDGLFNADRADVHQDDQINNIDALVLFNWTLGNVRFIPTPALPDRVHLVRQDGSGHFTTIQSAIDAATTGDTVIVYPGRYFENINISGVDFILTSTDPLSTPVVETTVIDANSSGTVVTFAGTESSTFRLCGLTITGGRNEDDSEYPGTIFCASGIAGHHTKATLLYNRIIENGSGPNGSLIAPGGLHKCDGLIMGNVIAQNSAPIGTGAFLDCDGVIVYNDITSNFATNSMDYATGGLHGCDGYIAWNRIEGNRTGEGHGSAMTDCNGVIEGNSIIGNRTEGFGGTVCRSHGIIRGNVIVDNYNCGGALFLCGGVIENNLVADNYSNYPIGSSAALYMCSGVIRNNTIANNTVFAERVGVAGMAECSGEIYNNIIWGNATNDTTVQVDEATTSMIFSCIEGWTRGGEGNISLEPLFTDAERGDYSLSPESPCIDAGKDSPALTDDLLGNKRPTDGTDEPRGDGSDYDMGAYEFHSLQ